MIELGWKIFIGIIGFIAPLLLIIFMMDLFYWDVFGFTEFQFWWLPFRVVFSFVIPIFSIVSMYLFIDHWG